ncbi:siderophore synthetase component [Hamadaea flava]|uniref:IucA/IucC family protein n=1 Tax=Hamadaea flava TaxID=1742688 RepID=A0ABV8M157_9ACTN|nr:IucA/IucC family siderophore biosynthesis protein [Hamadaea flava]MCP2321938.1 siderophore synthetase component [Hamadaea flava]
MSTEVSTEVSTVLSAASSAESSAGPPTKHLRPELWAKANRHLAAKALAEFAHERLLTPIPHGDESTDRFSDRFTVRANDTEYRFTARLFALDHWQIDPDSVTRVREGAQLPVDAVDLILDLRDTLGLSPAVLPVYLEEITSTLAGLAYKFDRPPADLSSAGFQAIETGMTEGHPCFVANNGRLGYSISDFHEYAPEAAHPIRLTWIAVHRSVSTFTSCSDVGYDTLISGELDASTLERLTASLDEPGDYHLMPVHPWQWRNRIAVTFAGEVAQGRIVHLGDGDDLHQAQQSVRTFYNVSAPERHYVKTALSVLNMGFLRGLSAEYMQATPAINEWLAGLIADDPVLAKTGLTILRERAAIGYRHPQYAHAAPKGSPYRKMLAALWRESPVLAPGERVTTMAALLHEDLAVQWITRSGLPAAEWLRRYLTAYLTPLVHCFYAYELVFMPHGENVILVLDEHDAPVRTIFKDIAEEIAVMDPDLPLPAAAERIRVSVPDELKLLSLFTDVLDCFFRFLAPRLEPVLPEAEFWQLVADCVRDYQAANPALAERYAKYDMFAERFDLSCLNRLQLRNNQQMVDLEDPSGALQLVGTLANPLHTASWG